jgi:ribonucleoside-diphosphate reductase alpha chain
VPVKSLVKKFAHQRFEPMGMTTNANIPFAKSLVDYIFRWLGMEFVEGYREANAPQRPSAETPAPRRQASPVASEGEGASGEGQPDPPAPTRLPTNGAGDGNGAGDSNGDADAKPDATAPQCCATAVATETGRLTVQIAEDGGTISATESAVRVINALDRSHAALMGDAPACDVCGAITLRNGTCYKCLNCGNSMGCS